MALGTIAVALLPSASEAGGFLTGLGFQGAGWAIPLLIPNPCRNHRLYRHADRGLPHAKGAAMIQWLRSLIFIVQTYVAMLVLGLVFFPWALFSSRGAHAACHAWASWVIWTMRWMTGIKTEIRGTPPADEVLVPAKHQSFLDIIMIYNAMPRGKFIMKRILIFAPILGQYALRIGCVPVNRGKRGAAIKKMPGRCKIGQAAGRAVNHLPPRHPRRPGRSPAPTKSAARCFMNSLAQPVVPVAGQCWPVLAQTRNHAPSGHGGRGVSAPDRAGPEQE